jgi:hypothetical protein
MKLEINIDETMFKDVLEKELNAFSEEELHEILRGCIIEFFNKNDNIKKMFLQEKPNYWGNSTDYEPTGLLKDIVKNKFDYNEPYEEVKEKILEFCKKEDVMKSLLKEMIADSFTNMFTGSIFFNSNFRDNIANVIREVIYDEKNQGRL